jgi:hypothetical protein
MKMKATIQTFFKRICTFFVYETKLLLFSKKQVTLGFKILLKVNVILASQYNFISLLPTFFTSF